MTREDTTLTPEYIVETFKRSYEMVYGQPAYVNHLFAEWYQVNGETVHRLALFAEITRLQSLAQKQQMTTTSQKSVVQRLIAKLRGG